MVRMGERSESDATESSPGDCPECSNAIPPGSVLITYESPAGDVRRLAECLNCEGTVNPV